MRTLIDKPETGTRTLPDDVQTSFTTWKALDRLRLLAEAAVKPGAGAATREALNKTFTQGLSDLQSYLSTAPSDKLTLAFDKPVRRAQTTAVEPGLTSYSTSITGKAVTENRDDVMSGLTGTERFRIQLAQGSRSDSVTVDLSNLNGPPTLDSVATLINQAISAIPYRDANGDVVLQDDGSAEPKWKVSFEPRKTEDGWALEANRQSYESISIDQIDAPDAVLVATGITGLETATAARVMRIDDPTGEMSRKTLATIAAHDRLDPDLAVKTTADAVATDADGFGYVLGTAAGDLGSQRAAGEQDLYLTKMDSLGNVVWQHSLGAAESASGAALSIAANGDVVLAGNVSGKFDGADSDGDMLVARFDTDGNEKFSTLVRAVGTDTATSVLAAPDGSIYVGGQSSPNGGDAFIAKLDSEGRLRERHAYDAGGSETIASLAMGSDGKLLALTREGAQSSLRFLDTADLSAEVSRIDLGTSDARAIAVDASGNIAIGGTTLAALPGTQVNSTVSSRDGFVARMAADGSGLAVTYLASDASDQVDSLVFSGDTLYVGGRTNGVLGDAKGGAVDGFVARLDATTGAIGQITQFGQPGQRTEPVRLAISSGGNNRVSDLGFGRGELTPAGSLSLTASTSLRAGDSFQMRVDGGALRTITITADDTLQTLADRIRKIAGSKALVTTPRDPDGGASLAISPKAGIDIEFVSGPDGRDALEKLGLPAARVSGYDKVDEDAPKVRPGGSYGLGLDLSLSISTMKDAAAALSKINNALSISQTSYRSLYWDDLKATLVNGTPASSAGTAREQAMLANYQAALDRLSSTSTSSTSLFTGF
ncbi:hypothetical protein KY084_06230 [Stakelama sp. CBK3Z-3]|uniref:Regulatory protein FlaEY n=2 Tax=Stakelama flava TaxID=2860338 RepID=A0ABS6XJY7_9SPHN|nr:hypothetical protein [Stakelama flava]